MTVLFAFLHHVVAFALVAALAVELVLVRQELSLANTRKLMVVDLVYGASAGLLLAIGLLRVFFFEKGAAYYFSSHAFLGKFALFILIGLLSIIPTLEFLSWRQPVKAGLVPPVSDRKIKSIRSIIHYELAAIVAILLFAAIMAKAGLI